MIRKLINKVRHEIYLKNFKRKWRLNNQHNAICAANVFDISKVSAGAHSYGDLNVLHFGGYEYGLHIGSFVSIGPNVNFLVSAEHPIRSFLTFPCNAKFRIGENPGLSKGQVVVEDDVWIGAGAIILSGVRVGKGAVVGAGAVVAKDIPPYSIAVGNPARVVKSRFSNDVIRILERLDYSRITPEMVNRNKELFNMAIENIEGATQLAHLIERG